MNMKTWTNPTVEELDVELTAARLFATSPEDWNGKLELEGGQIVIGNGNNSGTGDENEDGELVVGQRS